MSGIHWEFEELFTQPTGEETLDNLRESHRRVKKYRTKTIKAEDMLYCEMYPICERRETARARTAKKTSMAQKNVNDRNAKKKAIILANANFTHDDLFLTLTLSGKAPGEAEARRIMRNYIARVKRYRKREKLPPMKYLYVIEFEDGDGKRKRIHYHLLMSGMDRDAAEKLWGLGWANTRRLQKNENGLEAIVRYMMKSKCTTRRYACSKNLVMPEPRISDRRFSKRKVERLAELVETWQRETFERAYPGYTLSKCEVKRSEFMAGAYIYATMRREKGEAELGKGKAMRNAHAVRRRR